jgi:polyisoprenoid-binding protein YceI
MKHSASGWLALLFLTVAGTLSAQRPVANGAAREGKLSFDGKATAGDFVGTTTSVTGEITGGANLGAVVGWIEAPTGSLRTGNDHRDRDMLTKSLEADKYPTLRFDLKSVTAQSGEGDSVAVTLKGELSIHGVSRSVELPGTVVLSASEARIRTDFPVDVRDYKVGSLSRFLGMFKMDPNIVVHVDVTFALHQT